MISYRGTGGASGTLYHRDAAVRDRRDVASSLHELQRPLRAAPSDATRRRVGPIFVRVGHAFGTVGQASRRGHAANSERSRAFMDTAER